MKIISLFKKNDNTVGITFDDGQFLFLSYEIFLKNNLKRDKDISDEQYEQLIYENRIYFIKRAAFNFLGRRQHGEKELYLKLLKKKYEKSLILEVLAELKEKALLDDDKFARQYIDENMKRKLWGRRKAEAELFKKGIDSKIVKSVLDDICGVEDEVPQAKIALEKKLKSIKITSETKDKVKQKLFRHLISKGFDYATASQVIEEANL